MNHSKQQSSKNIHKRGKGGEGGKNRRKKEKEKRKKIKTSYTSVTVYLIEAPGLCPAAHLA